MFKDLAAHFTPALELPYGDKTYVVQPPSKDVGLKLAAINAAGVAAYSSMLEKCPTCGQAGTPDVPAETLRLLESIRDVDAAQLSLGKFVYEQMLEDEVPGPHIDTMGLYALYYWTLGEETADAIMAAQAGGDASGGAAPATGRRSTPTGGRRTGSGSPTRVASTRGTGARRRA
ncbi:MAG: hypothetical protein J0H73_05285 [Salana multivorans]|uniref:DUF7426 family protein n=1 Tax=Salana multivorans TaxID=120377 RepID=UPI0009654ECA|nr:hypothetical protein [Salana multivorans]MBN8881711.1 hypothetical protein [Salana multivorans]OJX98674.1 MAG: hypothetical protein BGO96_04665 [Micrococcales bacterium 73-15]